ncbi:RsiV family protein, partial [Bacillus subtilis]|uniref:RsiV family protein n=1 Tax=Bacillus subtilis TaxID=1423 RepID=UPI0023ECFECD
KSLFKDDRYIKVISENIKEQMQKQMQEDPNKIYWVEDDDMTETFKANRADPNLYITDKPKLVISIDEYDAAPGYIRITVLTIPTSVISELLVGDRYIR